MSSKIGQWNYSSQRSKKKELRYLKGPVGQHLRDINWINIFFSQKKRERKVQKAIQRNMAPTFLNLGKEISSQIQETQRVPKKMNLKRPTPRYTIIQLSKVKDKERFLKATGEK